MRFASRFRALLGRLPTEHELSQFCRYLSLITQWNRVASLTAYRKPGEILEKLFLDSLLLLRLLPAPLARILDIGSGAGIPGIPIKIVQLEYGLTLIEARRRRSSFLATVVRELGLAGVQILSGRAEALIDGIPGLEGEFDVVLARCVGPVDSIVPVALRYLRSGGKFFASGPPARKLPFRQGRAGSWEIVTVPALGIQRRFLVVEKT